MTANRWSAVVLLLMSPGLGAAEPARWTHWRGPSQQGYVHDAKVPTTWSATENLLWKLDLPGRGNSTPMVWGDKVFLTYSRGNGDERHVLCVNLKSGDVLWDQLASKGVPPEKTHEWNGYASASCAVDDRFVIAFFGTPGLFCYDHHGKLVWKKTLGTFTNVRGWGVGASPIIWDDLVIQNCDNSGAEGLPKGATGPAAPMALIAFDKASGEERWRTPRNQGQGFSTPVLIPNPEGQVELVLNGPFGVWAYDPKTGKELWQCLRHKGEDDALFGEPLPVWANGVLVATSGRPGWVQAIKSGGRGDVSGSGLVWDVQRAKGSRDVASPLLHEGVVYFGDRNGFLSAHDFQKGELLFKERTSSKEFSASPLLIQGKILYVGADGTSYWLAPGRKLQIVARNVLKDGTEFRSSPVAVDGKLLLRSQKALYCIGEKKTG